MARAFDFRTSDDLPNDVVVLVDREDLDHVLGAERDPFGKFVLMAPLPEMDHDLGQDWPPGSIGSALAGLVDAGAGQLYPITSFSTVPSIAERGQSVSDIELDWVIGTEPHLILEQGLTGPGTPPPLVFDQRTAIVPGPLTVDATWTLTIRGGLGLVSAQVTLAWVDRVFWGRGGAAVLTEAQIEALSSTLEAELGQYAFSAGSDYWWIAAPDTYGPVNFYDAASRMPVPFDNLGTVVVTNTYGQAVVYRCWRSLYPQVAAGTISQGVMP